ncbi:TonB-dependent hemoglobin/transferrin/lactoferrin family receptor [Neorhizobium alkalisoli]|uniref:Hemoglobin/transferrin/lactoferrin receptor protein n=1 Tax=Neorhizobium alkalisoli TaxID=528178 RepID=A0A561QW69_9HYPH|nr:TonB-dependent hemoglobin/transferrin/lactoferrin family receptor [Neorhizobium alkalisoli]TWF54623.1 hemoglobin/transferrin/lactoferrin receptor protein [Neorhizobium alkalisoli]
MFLPRSRSLLVTCSAFALFACATAAGAQQAAQPAAGDSTELKPIVLSGKTSRVSKDGTAADTPLASETTRETILNRDIQSLDDLGNTVEPGVSFVSATKSVNIRGLEDDRILTTIDGIPLPFMTDPVRGAYGGVDAYDFSALSTIDILRGGDSSRAGSGALGGAVILRTLEPEDVISDGKDWGAITKFTYDSSDRSFVGSAAVAKKIENTSIMFQGSYKKGHQTESNGIVGGYGSERTEANPLGYDKSNLLFKLRQQLEGGHMIGVTAERFNNNSNEDLRQEQGATYQENAYDRTSDLRRERVSLDYRYNTLGDTFIDNAWGSLYWQRVLRTEGPRGLRLTPPVGEYYRISEKTEKDIGAVGALTGIYDTGSLKHKITLGGDVSFFTTHQYIDGGDTCDETIPTPSSCAYYHNNQSDEPDVDGTRLGFYLDDKISIGDSGFSITPGVRFDWFDYRPSSTAQYENNSGYAGVPAGVSDSQFSPKIRAAWEVRPDVELYAQWAMGFKAPSVSQLYSNYDNAPLYRQIGNPDLESETVNGFEIGANLGDSDFGGGVKAFYNKYKNFIDSETTVEPGYMLGTIEYFNRSRVKIWGLEGNIHKAFDNGIFTRASLAYAYGEDLDTGELINSVAPLKGIAAIGYEQENWGTELQFTAVKRVSNLSTSSFKAPGYGLFNLTGWYQPEQMKGLRIQAGIYNIFDRTYYDALETKDIAATNESSNRAFYSEPGRTFKISLTQRF